MQSTLARSAAIFLAAGLIVGRPGFAEPPTRPGRPVSPSTPTPVPTPVPGSAAPTRPGKPITVPAPTVPVQPLPTPTPSGVQPLPAQGTPAVPNLVPPPVGPFRIGEVRPLYTTIQYGKWEDPKTWQFLRLVGLPEVATNDVFPWDFQNECKLGNPMTHLCDVYVDNYKTVVTDGRVARGVTLNDTVSIHSFLGGTVSGSGNLYAAGEVSGGFSGVRIHAQHIQRVSLGSGASISPPNGTLSLGKYDTQDFMGNTITLPRSVGGAGTIHGNLSLDGGNLSPYDQSDSNEQVARPYIRVEGNASIAANGSIAFTPSSSGRKTLLAQDDSQYLEHPILHIGGTLSFGCKSPVPDMSGFGAAGARDAVGSANLLITAKDIDGVPKAGTGEASGHKPGWLSGDWVALDIDVTGYRFLNPMRDAPGVLVDELQSIDPIIFTPVPKTAVSTRGNLVAIGISVLRIGFDEMYRRVFDQSSRHVFGIKTIESLKVKGLHPVLYRNADRPSRRIALVTHGTSSAMYDWKKFDDWEQSLLPTAPKNISATDSKASERSYNQFDACKTYSEKAEDLSALAFELSNMVKHCGLDSEWSVWTLDWSEFATGRTDTRKGVMLGEYFNPFEASRVGAQIGRSWVDANLEDLKDCEEFHFLAHSAGAWVIDAMADRIKERGLEFTKGPPKVTLTFFDAFDMALFMPGLGQLGDTADVVENYYNTTDDLPGTSGQGAGLPTIAINVDVGSLELDSPDENFRLGWVATQLAKGLDPVSEHGWPYRWYTRTLRALNSEFQCVPCGFFPDCKSREWGAVRSPMFQQFLSSQSSQHVKEFSLERSMERLPPGHYQAAPNPFVPDARPMP